MMKKIWKFQLGTVGRQAVCMPENSRILCAKNQREICLWVEVDADYSKVVERMFHIVGTGHVFNESKLEYIDTVICDPYVWHVYEEMELST